MIQDPGLILGEGCLCEIIKRKRTESFLSHGTRQSRAFIRCSWRRDSYLERFYHKDYFPSELNQEVLVDCLAAFKHKPSETCSSFGFSNSSWLTADS